MSSSEEPHSVVWKRTNHGSDDVSDDDVWDDRALIQAYDKAVSKVNAVIADKKYYNDKSSENSSSKVQHKNAKQVKKDSNKKTKIKWQVGHYCRAVYGEDNIEYDAQITAINPNNETCIVQYVGYGNEEEKSLHEIKPSLGRIFRKPQVHFEEGNSESDHDEGAQNVNRDNRPGRTGIKKRHFVYSHNEIPPWFAHPPPFVGKMPFISQHTPSSSNTSSHHTTPPPPPFMPQEMPVPNEEEALASMLMSWYMSGYHTGYYKALKQSRSHCNCQH